MYGYFLTWQIMIYEQSINLKKKVEFFYDADE